jgi:hypothetical protein
MLYFPFIRQLGPFIRHLTSIIWGVDPCYGLPLHMVSQILVITLNALPNS